MIASDDGDADLVGFDAEPAQRCLASVVRFTIQLCHVQDVFRVLRHDVLEILILTGKMT